MKFLNRSYPFQVKTSNHIFIAIGTAIWVFLFLFLIKPLTVSTLTLEEQLFFLPFYSIISGVSYTISILFQKKMYQKKQQWKVYDELIILLLLCIISLITIWLFFRFVVTIDDSEPFTFSEFLIDIFSPALLIILPLVIIARYFIGKYALKGREKIRINGSGNYEHLELFLEDLLYIQSSNNYVEVHYLQKENILTTVVRNNISKVSDENTNLLRIQRSFLINPLHYKEWKIEKGKHFIVLSRTIKLPVSKTYLENAKERFHLTTK